MAEFIKRLKAAKFTEEQAEILAIRDEQHISELMAYQSIESKKLVTNEHLDIVKLELQKGIEITKLGLQKEIEITKLGLQKEIEKTRSQIIIWISGLLGTFSVFFLGILAKGFHWI